MRIRAILFSLACVTKIWGTAQIPDHIIINKDTLALFTTPLEEMNGRTPDSLLSNPKTPRFFKDGMSTACWRGYQGIWKIENNKLFLVAVKECHGGKSANLKSYFKADSVGRIMAEWYTGELRVPTGKSIESAPMGFSLHSIEYKIFVIRGEVFRVVESKSRKIEIKEIVKVEDDSRMPSQKEIQKLEID